MLCVYTFLVGCLVVSTLIHIDEDYWKDRDYTKRINIWGLAVTILVPLLLFIFLVAL